MVRKAMPFICSKVLVFSENQKNYNAHKILKILGGLKNVFSPVRMLGFYAQLNSRMLCKAGEPRQNV